VRLEKNGVLRKGIDLKYAWIACNKKQWLVSMVCDLLEVSTSGCVEHVCRKGDCWDNAPTESLWGRLKVGRLYGRNFETRRQAVDEVIDWVMFYNHRRVQSTLGYASPMQFEKSWCAAQLLKAASLIS
jgi:hypothetical protein